MVFLFVCAYWAGMEAKALPFALNYIYSTFCFLRQGPKPMLSCVGLRCNVARVPVSIPPLSTRCCTPRYPLSTLVVLLWPGESCDSPLTAQHDSVLFTSLGAHQGQKCEPAAFRSSVGPAKQPAAIFSVAFLEVCASQDTCWIS